MYTVGFLPTDLVLICACICLSRIFGHVC
uniref:Uncharacterized protein n=1 Tax=Arundo donax TaxID=35708 RepID=A0A0A9ERL8_ARUDO